MAQMTEHLPSKQGPEFQPQYHIIIKKKEGGQGLGKITDKNMVNIFL
jgi:hypothetical protein